MGGLRFPALFALLTALSVSPSHASEPTPPVRPSVDLRHVRWHDHVATVGSGHAQAELTLDADLTHAADELLRDASARAAAIIVVDLQTAEILVYTDRAAGGGSTGLLSSARAPAASVFKLVTTAALFESTKLTPREQICTVGGERGVERKHLEIPTSAEARCAPLGQALGHSLSLIHI